MSNKFKGTPGPWLATVRNNNDMMTQYYGVLIGSVSVDVPTENEKVDSKLIAAAPELLEALIEMQRNGQKQGWNDNYEFSMLKTQKAINKALGE